MIQSDPPRSEWLSLRPSLTAGERYVGDTLLLGLAPPWELYVQPHMNGLRPDFVLLHPHRGVAVLEVKDWPSGDRDVRAFESALRKVKRYVQEIRELYCPSLGRRYRQHARGWLVLPYAQREDTEAVVQTVRGVGGEILAAEDMGPALIEMLGASLPDNREAAEEACQDLRRWLIEPEFNQEQRRLLQVDRNQEDLITSRTTSGYRRIRGPAGSGKSLVIAGRAAELARTGRQVLVVTFNITLLNYLRDLAVRWPAPGEASRAIRTHVTWLNFHQWCKRVCVTSSRAEEYTALWHEDVEGALEDGVAELTESVLREGHPEAASYDAVLCDEGQDFKPSWWQALRLACRPDGEMVLAADSSQDLYQHAGAWTEQEMGGAGFSGRWSELRTSYRLPEVVIDLARQFAERFLPSELAILPERVQGELGLSPVTLEWRQVRRGEDAVAACLDALEDQLAKMDDLGISELVFLASSKKTGKRVAEELGGRGIRVTHTFADGGSEARKAKMSFYKGSARVKATTLHSFKGWESRAILLHIGPRWGPDAMATAYAGLTRVRRSTRGSILTVVNESADLWAYGRDWPTGSAPAPPVGTTD